MLQALLSDASLSGILIVVVLWFRHLHPMVHLMTHRNERLTTSEIHMYPSNQVLSKREVSSAASPIVVATVGWGAVTILGAVEASTLPHDASYVSVGD